MPSKALKAAHKAHEDALAALQQAAAQSIAQRAVVSRAQQKLTLCERATEDARRAVRRTGVWPCG